MNNADREILVAEIDNLRVLIRGPLCLLTGADKIDFFFRDVSGGSRFRPAGLGECHRRAQNRRDN